MTIKGWYAIKPNNLNLTFENFANSIHEVEKLRISLELTNKKDKCTRNGTGCL